MSGQPKNTGFMPKHQDEAAGFSYWETKGWLQDLDAVVVGGGIVGMSAALHLRVNHPDWHILILDCTTLGGATTRNAGFACFGSPSELLEDWKQLGAESTVDLVKMRWEGLRELRQTWGDDAIGYQACGAIEAFTDADLMDACNEALPDLNEALTHVLGHPPFEASTKNVEAGLIRLKGIIKSPLEGALDAARMTKTFRQQLHLKNISFLAGHQVQSLKHSHDEWTLVTNEGTLAARKVLIANNGWASELLELDVEKAPNTVVVSQPLAGLTLKSTVHHDRGYVYARDLDGRLLIGGGRNWNCANEEERISKLKAWAREHVTGASDFEASVQWRGYLGVGATRGPILRDLGNGLYAGVRMGGMGVAIGTVVGRNLASMV